MCRRKETLTLQFATTWLPLRSVCNSWLITVVCFVNALWAFLLLCFTFLFFCIIIITPPPPPPPQFRTHVSQPKFPLSVSNNHISFTIKFFGARSYYENDALLFMLKFYLSMVSHFPFHLMQILSLLLVCCFIYLTYYWYCLFFLSL